MIRDYLCKDWTIVTLINTSHRDRELEVLQIPQTYIDSVF
jgi:hypothetical protein